MTGATGPAGPAGPPGTGGGGTGASGLYFNVNPGFNASGNGNVVNNAQSLFFATRTPNQIKVEVGQVSPGNMVVYIDSLGSGSGATGATGAPAPLTAAQFNMKSSGQGSTINDKQNIPYTNAVYQPDQKITVSSDGTVNLKESGNYMFNFSVATNGTSAVPNIHVIVNDANGTRDIDFINVMPNGQTNGSLILPISGPGKVAFQVQGQGAQIKIPGAQPQGELSVVKIS